MTKKVYKEKMFFSVLTKNLNWQILTKNLVTFKRVDGIKDEKFNMGDHWKIWFLGRVRKKPIYMGKLLKKGRDLDSLQI